MPHLPFMRLFPPHYAAAIAPAQAQEANSSKVITTFTVIADMAAERRRRRRCQLNHQAGRGNSRISADAGRAQTRVAGLFLRQRSQLELCLPVLTQAPERWRDSKSCPQLYSADGTS